jgi:hypothetical protein
VVESFDGVLQGALSINVIISYHQPETCVEPDVFHVATCTWHGISATFHGLVGRCEESFQKFWFHDIPWSDILFPHFLEGSLCILDHWVREH